MKKKGGGGLSTNKQTVFYILTKKKKKKNYAKIISILKFYEIKDTNVYCKKLTVLHVSMYGGKWDKKKIGKNIINDRDTSFLMQKQ